MIPSTLCFERTTTVNDMYLHEAIRLGAMATEQGRGNRSMLGHARCALGGALYAIGYVPLERESPTDSRCYHFLIGRWPILHTMVKIPVGALNERVNLLTAIYMLNDMAGWTREAIADWVETIERRAESRDRDRPTTATGEPTGPVQEQAQDA